MCGHAIDAANPSGVAHVRTSDVSTDTDNVIGCRDVSSGRSTNGRVTATGGVGNERIKTIGRVTATNGVANERSKTVGRVGAAGGVVIERLNTVGRVHEAGGVSRERLNTVGRVLHSGSVIKHCQGAHGCVLAFDIEKQRTCADSGVEAGGGVAKERKRANCCVPRAGGETRQGVLPFRRVEPGITAIRRRNYRVRWLQKRQAGE